MLRYLLCVLCFASFSHCSVLSVMGFFYMLAVFFKQVEMRRICVCTLVCSTTTVFVYDFPLSPQYFTANIPPSVFPCLFIRLNDNSIFFKNAALWMCTGNLASGLSSERSSVQSSTGPSPMATMRATTMSYTARNTSAMGGSKVSKRQFFQPCKMALRACMGRGFGIEEQQK